MRPPGQPQPARRLFAQPPGYPNVAAWFFTGALRDWPGLTVALVATWFNLPLAILGGGIGLVGGAIFGYLGGFARGSEVSGIAPELPVLGTDLISFLLQGGGVLGLLVGAVLGAVGGFLGGLLAPWAFAFSDDPAKGVALMMGQLLTVLLCGLLYTLYGVVAEGWRLKLTGAREPSRRERELILPILAECARRLGLNGYPKLLVDDSREPNASATSWHIVVNRGFLDEFDYDPETLAGVLCHELTHWRNADAISSYFVRGVALPLYLAYSVVSWLMRVLRHPLIVAALWMVAWPLLVCVRYVIMPAQAYSSQLAEYAADQSAVMAGHRTGIRRVLTRFRRSFDGARNGWDRSICASHPPNELRLERLEEPGARYPLPDADVPAKPLPVAVASALPRD